MKIFVRQSSLEIVANTLSNLITLCSDCHDKIEGNEELFIEKYQQIIDGKNVRFDYAQHITQGKTYLRQGLSKLCRLILTTGGEIQLTKE
ncbi:hypothetical protein CLLI_26980 [Clostridium liquoris]|jgi:hypothetical protein|uniref:HNH domain-containing protein n=1 Tax=Clostridium liquoris TaxID=1289519 RepID=A0A2T0B065_9CLOT|nr:HNH endonuclease [Clostridium liquoris]PRR76906.1 hypothetical protein CLLI_26980 [Clostridium liquoris]